MGLTPDPIRAKFMRASWETWELSDLQSPLLSPYESTMWRQLGTWLAVCPLQRGAHRGRFCSSVNVLSEESRWVAGSGILGAGLNKDGVRVVPSLVLAFKRVGVPSTNSKGLCKRDGPLFVLARLAQVIPRGTSPPGSLSSHKKEFK